MSLFDQADRLASAAMDSHFGDPVHWRPMTYRAGSRFTSDGTAGGRPDPARPARGLDQSADPFTAVIVWRAGMIDPGTSANEQGGLPSGDVMLDFNVILFRQPSGAVELPRKGDIFDMPQADGSVVKVYLARDPVDDGTQRIQCWCIAPE